MDSRVERKSLERNPLANIREGWGPLRHHIAVPEPIFVQELERVARERFGDEFARLTRQTRETIEDAVNDPLHWDARPNYHARGCPACSAP